MSESFENYGSDQESGDGMEYIPKTPGPALVPGFGEEQDSGKEQDSDKEEGSGDERRSQKGDISDKDDGSDKDQDSPKDQGSDVEMGTVSNTAKDIFGEVSSDDEDEDRERKTNSDAGYPERSLVRGANADEDEDGDRDNQQQEPVDVVPEPARIEVEIPRISANLGSEINFVKLPNFLSVDTHPYDPQWYEDEIYEDDEQCLDEEGRARLKLKVENTIRWRSVCDAEGQMTKESNARVVKWSDGSMSLHLGSEIFDVHKQHMMAGDHNHLFIRQGTGLQGQAVFRTKLTFRPYSTDSFTHRKMTLSLADRSQKKQQIKVLPTVGKDPEAHRTEMLKKEEDKLKASIRRENKARRVRERSHHRAPTASYLEPDGYDDEDDEAISLAAIKNRYKKGTYNTTYTDSDDDGSDLEIGAKKAIDGKRAKVVDSDDDDD